MAGSELELDMKANDAVLVLRSRIANAWQLPAACLILSVESVVLEELSATLRDVLAVSSLCPVVYAVVSSEPLYDIISNGGPRDREAAIEDLAFVATEAYERSVAVLTRSLLDRVKYVKIAAIETLAKVRKSEDSVTLRHILLCLGDRSREVRHAAVEALRYLHGLGDAGAIDAFRACLGPERETFVKICALEILGEKATRGDGYALALAATCLEDASYSVRLVAVGALGKMAIRGDRTVVQALSSRCKDPDWEVRSSAITELGTVALAGDTEAIQVAHELSQDPESSVRSAAAFAADRLQGIPGV